MTPDLGQDIAEGSGLFLIPGGAGDRDPAVRVQGVGEQRDQAEEAEEARGRPLDGGVRPLPLRLDAEVSAALFVSSIVTSSGQRFMYSCRMVRAGWSGSRDRSRSRRGARADRPGRG